MDLFQQKHIAPMLIDGEKPAFDDPDWLFELKWDGTRCLAYLDPQVGIHLENKRFKILTPGFPELRNIHKQVTKRCILDGELMVLEKGRVNFAEIQRRSLMNHPFKIELAAAKLPATFVAFDILLAGEEPVMDRPLEARKELLQSVVRESERLAAARYLREKGTALYRLAEEQGMEGIIAKRSGSRYRPGYRTKDWIKCKHWLDDDFVVCGYYYKQENLLSVVLGQYGHKGLEYQGHVVMGVSREDFGRMTAVSLVEKDRGYGAFPIFEDAVWLEPRLVCKVQYMERTAKGGLRQPVFRGLRDDKAPKDCMLSK